MYTFKPIRNTKHGAHTSWFDDLLTQYFNYIIVGGGTAGNVLANRLTEDPNVSVLVLEAGLSTSDVLLSEVPFFGPRLVPGTPWDWNFTTTEQPGFKGRSVLLPRGFGLGGSSAVTWFTCVVPLKITTVMPGLVMTMHGDGMIYSRTFERMNASWLQPITTT
ncbi:GMC oxidoreductase-domain-containing protein [Desarmillaria ectypa]|nr:GMC oxidoreductase-domain-containing protein [Desarmillaria ectypa]